MKLNQHFTTQISEILFSAFDVVAIFHFSPPTLHCMARGAFESLSPSCTFQGDTALYYILPFENHSRISCQKNVKKLSRENRNLRFYQNDSEKKKVLVDQFGSVQFTRKQTRKWDGCVIVLGISDEKDCFSSHGDYKSIPMEHDQFIQPEIAQNTQTKGTQDPGQRLSTPVQFFKL